MIRRILVAAALTAVPVTVTAGVAEASYGCVGIPQGSGPYYVNAVCTSLPAGMFVKAVQGCQTIFGSNYTVYGPPEPNGVVSRSPNCAIRVSWGYALV